MTKKILIRFGDLMLKGKNIGLFLKKVKLHINNKMKDLVIKIENKHDRVYIEYLDQDEHEILRRLGEIPGLYSFSIVYVTNPTIDDIVEVAAHVIDKELESDNIRFKIETKRADKTFPMTSQEISIEVSFRALAKATRKVIVDVRQPQETLYIEVRRDRALLYLKSIRGMGGFPAGIAGKGLLMMSGGIDSPVAAYLAMKQGIELELFHFESTPLTPLESVQKVIDLAKKISVYAPNECITLHLVPFTHIHEEILKVIPNPYIITVMRRMMYRLAERYARKEHLLCIVNGESVGQVASQTLQSMKTVEAVTSYPIIRPVVTYDKTDIIALAKKIDTFNLSIKPFNDCCSIYVPKSPATKPMHIYALKYEELMTYEPLLVEAIEKIKTLYVTPDEDLEISRYGFTVEEAIVQYLQEKEDDIDHIETKPVI